MGKWGSYSHPKTAQHSYWHPLNLPTLLNPGLSDILLSREQALQGGAAEITEGGTIALPQAQWEPPKLGYPSGNNSKTVHLVVCPTRPRLFSQKKSPCPSMVHSTHRLYSTEGWEQKNSLIDPLPLVYQCSLSSSQNWNLFSLTKPCRFHLLKVFPLFCLLCICTATAFVHFSVISSCELVHHPHPNPSALFVSCSCVSPIQSLHSTSRSDLSTTFISSSHSPA